MNSKFAKIKTYDGCDIQLYHQASLGDSCKAPVLLVHGFAANANMWRPPFQEGHLASYLSHYGYPVYSIDLRFRSGSPQKGWSLDDYVFFDIPAAIEHITQMTGHSQIHWIGHSMGGLLGYMYQAVAGSRKIASLTTLGAPGLRAPGAHFRTASLAKNMLNLAGFGVKSGRLDLIPGQIMSHLIKLGFLSDPEHRRKLNKYHDEELRSRPILGNISYNEARQIASVLSKPGVRSSRFSFRYWDFRSNITAPLLVLAGNKDYIIPEKIVKQGFTDASSPQKSFLILSPETASCTYGHLDLIMSPFAKKDIWERVLEWLEQLSSGKNGVSPLFSVAQDKKGGADPVFLRSS